MFYFSGRSNECGRCLRRKLFIAEEVIFNNWILKWSIRKSVSLHFGLFTLSPQLSFLVKPRHLSSHEAFGAAMVSYLNEVPYPGWYWLQWTATRFCLQHISAPVPSFHIQLVLWFHPYLSVSVFPWLSFPPSFPISSLFAANINLDTALR